MESLSELISLASIILDDGFDLQCFLDWKELSFVALLSLFGPFHYYTFGFHPLTAPNPLVVLWGRALVLVPEERLLATASAFRAYQVPSLGGHTSVPPRDPSARKNF